MVFIEGERLSGIFSCEPTVSFSEGGELGDRGVAVDWVSSVMLSEFCVLHTSSWSDETAVRELTGIK